MAPSIATWPLVRSPSARQSQHTTSSAPPLSSPGGSPLSDASRQAACVCRFAGFRQVNKGVRHVPFAGATSVGANLKRTPREEAVQGVNAVPGPAARSVVASHPSGGGVTSVHGRKDFRPPIGGRSQLLGRMIHEWHCRRTRGEASTYGRSEIFPAMNRLLTPAGNVRSAGGQRRDGTGHRASPLNRLFSSPSFQRTEEPDEPSPGVPRVQACLLGRQNTCFWPESCLTPEKCVRIIMKQLGSDLCVDGNAAFEGLYERQSGSEFTTKDNVSRGDAKIAKGKSATSRFSWRSRRPVRLRSGQALARGWFFVSAVRNRAKRSQTAVVDSRTCCAKRTQFGQESVQRA